MSGPILGVIRALRRFEDGEIDIVAVQNSIVSNGAAVEGASVELVAALRSAEADLEHIQYAMLLEEQRGAALETLGRLKRELENERVAVRIDAAIASCVACDPDQNLKQTWFGVEVLDAPGVWSPPDPMPRDDFDLVFSDVFRVTGRDWVNLNLRSVTKDERLIVLEYFINPENADFGQPPANQIHINVSGLSNGPEARQYPCPQR